MNHLSTKLCHVMKSGFYAATRNDQLSSWTKEQLQSRSQSWTCTRKGHGHCLVVFCLSDPLQLSESWENHYIWKSMFSKLMRCIENCNTCTQHWSTEMAQFFPMTMPAHTSSHTQHFKSWTNWAIKFCLICHIHVTSRQLTTTSWSIWTIVLQGKRDLQPTRCRKCFLRVHQIPKHRFLYYSNKVIACWQVCVDCNGSYFD